MRRDESQIGQDWQKDWPTVFDRYYWCTRRHYQIVEQYLHGKVLDVGCGPGYLAARVFPNEGHYTGVDVSEAALAHGRMLFPGAQFHRVDITRERLPFADDTFDTVVASEIVEHLDSFQNLLKEIRRVSREYMVVTVPTSMGGCGHVWPVWTCEDVHKQFACLGKFIEVRHCIEAHFHLVWVRK